jgi:hypothetical protein
MNPPPTPSQEGIAVAYGLHIMLLKIKECIVIDCKAVL